MDTDKIFINIDDIPKQLSKQEVYELLDKIKIGNEQAKEKLAEHNIRLVLAEVTRKFKNVNYDKKDLVSVGIVGLMKAITTFDTSKKVEFSTYAVKCIDNEILYFLRKQNKHTNNDSLDKILSYDKNGKEFKVENTLSYDTDIIEEYTNNEMYLVIRQIVKDLPERDKTIIMLHFGFYNDKTYTQKEIAEMLSVSQSWVSRLIEKITKQVGKQLEEKGFIELRTKKITNDKIIETKEQIPDNEIKENNEKTTKIGRPLQTIYEYFNLYNKEQIDMMLETLSKEERALITLRYGEDLNNPIGGSLDKKQKNKFYGTLIPKMKKILANQNEEIKTSNKKIIAIETKQTEKKQVQDKIEKSGIESLSKDEYLKILELLKTPTFNRMISELSVKEAVVISLKLGYIDGKYFKTDSIAQFLGIEQQEVIDITKKVLLLHKENINQFIDNAIQIITEEPKAVFTSIDKPIIK